MVVLLVCAAGVNPLAGCLPTLATIPVFIGLYRALTLAAQDNLLDQDFFWIPSLSGPASTSAQAAVSSQPLAPRSKAPVSRGSRGRCMRRTWAAGPAPPNYAPDGCRRAPQGMGLSWLFPFVDGHPPIGWGAAGAYLVLPVLLVVSQYASQRIISPPNNDPQQQQAQAILKFLPLMIGEWRLATLSSLQLLDAASPSSAGAASSAARRRGGREA